MVAVSVQHDADAIISGPGDSELLVSQLATRVSRGEMPPGRPWGAADIDTLMQWLRGFDTVGSTAQSLDRYQLASALAAVRATPDAGGHPSTFTAEG